MLNKRRVMQKCMTLLCVMIEICDNASNAIYGREVAEMDTTYVGIMLVVFLVLTALAIDVGYMYVSEEDLQAAAEVSALAGAQSIKQRIYTQIQSDPKKLKVVVNDKVQPLARASAIESAMGKHAASTLVELASNSTNNLTENNDITVGFWNASSHSYSPGVTPVNAMQVRTRRTAESASVGLGTVGSFLATISGIGSFNNTPVAIAAIPPHARANISLCLDACDSNCRYPNVCTIPERRMINDPSYPVQGTRTTNRYAYTSLLYPVTGKAMLSDLICKEMPAQDVCGKNIFTAYFGADDMLRDMESMMYNPHIDKMNKEYDNATGKLTGWWVIAPVTACSSPGRMNSFEPRHVTDYALIRISRICVSGTTGCKQNNTSYDSPSATCGSENGLYIDRISCAGCGSESILALPGLQPSLVK